MGLVDYSDSETSDIEETSASTPLAIPDPGAPKPSTTFSAQFDSPRSSLPGTPKESASGPRRIKVDLSALKQTAIEADEEGADEPPAKRARTAGAFSGFNSLLPAPKRTAAQNAPKAGVSLKTSSEAAFSRSVVPTLEDGGDDVGYDEFGGAIGTSGSNGGDAGDSTEPEVKIVGKATRFKPLSASSKKKKRVIPKAAVMGEARKGASTEDAHAKLDDNKETKAATEEAASIAPVKPKRSLFSVPQQDEVEDVNTATAATGTYESITTTQLDDTEAGDDSRAYTTQHPTTAPTQSNPNSLHSLTSDLNLTAAQKRQLFGRNGNADISIAHFNMDSEYAANEQLRQAGEMVEHKAVKAIAPGKHSLQQLVNNARSQQENLEDKWAAGRAARGTMR